MTTALVGRGRERRFALGAAACLVAGLVITVAVHFPINRQLSVTGFKVTAL